MAKFRFIFTIDNASQAEADAIWGELEYRVHSLERPVLRGHYECTEPDPVSEIDLTLTIPVGSISDLIDGITDLIESSGGKLLEAATKEEQ